MISAIFEREYNIGTISWWLGSEVSYIEIDHKVNLTAEQIARVEDLCNEAIAAAKPVNVHILNDKDENDVPAEVSVLIHFITLTNCKRNSEKTHFRNYFTSIRLLGQQKAYQRIMWVTFV